MSKTYELKMNIFEKGQPEELITLMKNFKKTIKETITTTVAGRINYLCNMLHGTMNAHLKEKQEGLLSHLLL